MALWYYGGEVEGDLQLQYQRGFSLGTEDFGTTEETAFVFPQSVYIGEDQTICGVSFRKQSFQEEPTDVAENVYTNWRLSVCSVGSA